MSWKSRYRWDCSQGNFAWLERFETPQSQSALFYMWYQPYTDCANWKFLRFRNGATFWSASGVCVGPTAFFPYNHVAWLSGITRKHGLEKQFYANAWFSIILESLHNNGMQILLSKRPVRPGESSSLGIRWQCEKRACHTEHVLGEHACSDTHAPWACPYLPCLPGRTTAARHGVPISHIPNAWSLLPVATREVDLLLASDGAVRTQNKRRGRAYRHLIIKFLYYRVLIW